MEGNKGLNKYKKRFMIRNFVWPSILGTLLCNIFICNVFTFTKEKDIPCHADDNTTYTASSKTNMAIKKLEKCSERTEQNPILINIIS